MEAEAQWAFRSDLPDAASAVPMRDRGDISMSVVEAASMRTQDDAVMRMESVALATKSPNGADYYVLDSTRWNRLSNPDHSHKDPDDCAPACMRPG